MTHPQQPRMVFTWQSAVLGFVAYLVVIAIIVIVFISG
jgi:hypothetical protein